jgi:hypothetical protein
MSTATKAKPRPKPASETTQVLLQLGVQADARLLEWARNNGFTLDQLAGKSRWFQLPKDRRPMRS